MCACTRAAWLCVVVVCLPVLQVATMAADHAKVPREPGTQMISILPNELATSKTRPRHSTEAIDKEAIKKVAVNTAQW